MGFMVLSLDFDWALHHLGYGLSACGVLLCAVLCR
jgi:hypothetical protein